MHRGEAVIIPSIDLMNGKAVQLRQGKEKVLEREDVISLATEFRKYGEIAVIDLDAALGKGNNLKLIKKLCKIADCRVGGGIRTIKKANELLMAGAKKIIIGTKANPDFLRQLPKARVIVAVDSKASRVMGMGWTKSTGKTTEEKIAEAEPYCSEFLFTNIDHEGLMQGIDMEKVKKIQSITKNSLTAAGGISTIDEMRVLEDLGVNSQLGMSIYAGRIKMDEAFASLLVFNKGLIPTIVQDETNQVLMLAYSTRESVLNTFKTGKATYYSRSRKSLWTKGETSGNFQELVKARYDCDRDALLFTVKQKNVACHKGKYSCFGEKAFSIEDLYAAVKDRLENPNSNSYTSKISEDKTLKKKIMEECKEVVNYTGKENLVWEIADLIYFITILMAKNNVSYREVMDELWRRRK